MKTFRQFREEAEFAVECMMLEARGSGGIAKTRRKKKKEFLSPRERKSQKLENRLTHWQGLE